MSSFQSRLDIYYNLFVGGENWELDKIRVRFFVVLVQISEG